MTGINNQPSLRLMQNQTNWQKAKDTQPRPQQAIYRQTVEKNTQSANPQIKIHISIEPIGQLPTVDPGLKSKPKHQTQQRSCISGVTHMHLVHPRNNSRQRVSSNSSEPDSSVCSMQSDFPSPGSGQGLSSTSVSMCRKAAWNF